MSGVAALRLNRDVLNKVKAGSEQDTLMESVFLLQNARRERFGIFSPTQTSGRIFLFFPTGNQSTAGKILLRATPNNLIKTNYKWCVFMLYFHNLLYFAAKLQRLLIEKTLRPPRPVHKVTTVHALPSRLLLMFEH